MATAALVARLVLAGVFIVAGVGKLLDRRGSRRALRDFGVPEPLTRFGATALPLAELATAAALLIQPAAPWGAVAALVLLVGFTIGIVNALARGRAPDCHCFGTVHSAPAGPSQVVRNGVLAAVAAVVVIEGAGSSTSTLVPAKDGAAVIELLLAVLALSLLVASLDLWRQRRGLREELTTARRIASAIPPGLPVGALAPAFAARDTDGETFTLDDLRSRGRPVVLVFGAPGCGPCPTLAPDLRRWQETLADTVTVGLVGIGAYFRYEPATDVDGGSVHDIYARDP